MTIASIAIVKAAVTVHSWTVARRGPSAAYRYVETCQELLTNEKGMRKKGHSPQCGDFPIRLQFRKSPAFNLMSSFAHCFCIFIVCLCIFRPSATASRIGLIESRTCRRGGPPTPWLGDPPWLATTWWMVGALGLYADWAYLFVVLFLYTKKCTKHECNCVCATSRQKLHVCLFDKKCITEICLSILCFVSAAQKIRTSCSSRAAI